MGKIYNRSYQIDFNNLAYYFKNNDIKFYWFERSIEIYENTKIDNISTKKIEENQKQFKLNLNEIIENPKSKSNVQLNKIKSIKNLYESRKKVIELHDDYAKTSEAKRKTK